MSALATTSPEVDEVDEEFPSDREITRIANRVRSACGDGTLPVARFAAVTSVELRAISAEDAPDALERIYSRIPDGLRLAYLNDVLTIAAERNSGPRATINAQGGCRCCGQEFDRLRHVDEDDICPDCWELPSLEPRESL